MAQLTCKETFVFDSFLKLPKLARAFNFRSPKCKRGNRHPDSLLSANLSSGLTDGGPNEELFLSAKI